MKPACKPVDKRTVKGTREALWKAIRKNKEFTLVEIANSCTLVWGTIAQYVRCLVRAGYLEASPVTDRGDKGQGKGYKIQLRYTLLKDSIEPPRVRADGSEITENKNNQRMWTTMRKRSFFTVSDVHALSSTRQQPLARKSVTVYMSHLEKAGYIARSGSNDTIERQIFRLVHDTGPKAPMIQRIKQVWDPNLKKVTWPIAEACSSQLIADSKNKDKRDE